jgi:hypothetical protein
MGIAFQLAVVNILRFRGKFVYVASLLVCKSFRFCANIHYMYICVYIYI